MSGLLALMLLTEARRPARTTGAGALVPLSEQDRTRWDRTLVAEGTTLATSALEGGPLGEYSIQAAIAALHDSAPSHEDTDWRTRPVALHAARAAHRQSGRAPQPGRGAGDGGRAPSRRWSSSTSWPLGKPSPARTGVHAVRAHLLEMHGDLMAAKTEYVAAADLSANRRERDYLTMKAAALSVV